RLGAIRAGRSKLLPEAGVIDELAEHIGHRRDLRLDDLRNARVEYLECSAGVASRDDGKARHQCFDEDEPEGLGRKVRLAEEVRGVEDRGNAISPAKHDQAVLALPVAQASSHFFPKGQFGSRTSPSGDEPYPG